MAGQYGFRPGDPRAEPAGLVTAANGADPAQPRRSLSLPTPQVLNTVLETWRRDRKPANVELVLDNSGSMADEDKLKHAKEGLVAFFKQVAPQDEIGLAKFSAEVTPLVSPAPYRENKAKLTGDRGHHPRGRHRDLRRAPSTASTRSRQRADAEHINAVVVLTDGEDTHLLPTPRRRPWLASSRRASQNPAACACSPSPTAREAEEPELTEFAEASGGKGFKASTDDIEAGLPLDLLASFRCQPPPRHPRLAQARQLAVNAATKPLNIPSRAR